MRGREGKRKKGEKEGEMKRSVGVAEKGGHTEGSRNRGRSLWWVSGADVG